MILSARALRFSYPGNVPALDGLSLDIRAGTRLAILGANGAGKTTLLLHLNGSLRPQAGEVWLLGERATYHRRFLTRWRSMVGLVLQDPDDQLFAGNVLQDVSFGPLNLGLTEAEVRERTLSMLATLGVLDLAERPVHMLSFGQKKRVAIAGVMAMRPRVLLLDEPTGGLDPDTQAGLVAALRSLADAGTTVVYTTHDVDLACAWSDQVAIFEAGKVSACGPAEQVLSDAVLLRRAGLRLPVVMELALAGRRAGLWPESGRLPRNRSDFITLLHSAAAGDGKELPSDGPVAVDAVDDDDTVTAQRTRRLS